MAIAGRPAARALRSKGTTAKSIKQSGASRKTKIAFAKLKRTGAGKYK